MPQTILHVAVFKPLRHCFDYLLPEDESANNQPLKLGIRLLVPFGKSQVVGILLKVNHTACISVSKLKPITAILDKEPLLSPNLLSLYHWASRYYQHPIGEVMLGTLPILLRQPSPTILKQRVYTLTPEGKAIDIASLKRSPRQARLLFFLAAQSGNVTTAADIKQAGFDSNVIQNLLKKGWMVQVKKAINHSSSAVAQSLSIAHRTIELPLLLNADQKIAVEKITQAVGFQTFLLEGVTGSGKTEVYLQIIDCCLQQGKQALVLVPEIGLTPQTILRFVKRFSSPVIALHSKLSNKERLQAWMQIQQGELCTVIGTRSALFAPFAQLGIIILDEEHDPSFKQQSGFRYSARDLAVVRGQLENIPVLLGSATPSLETLHNVNTGRFLHLPLPKRAGSAIMPTFHLIDLRRKKLTHGLSHELLTIMEQHLQAGNQALLFLNRRGYAPVLLCQACGWVAQCTRCDAKLTLHQKPMRLICHHCTKEYPVIQACHLCQSKELVYIGLGTQRIEESLCERFPDTDIVRIDRDTSPSKHAIEKTLDNIRYGHKQILIGTQMLAKGHHFPNVTLVGIVNVDSGLYSTDFRATERMGQLIQQVAGRAGRMDKPGHVFLQTHQPAHPLLQTLIHQGYPAFAEKLLQERKSSQWPPFSYLGLLRAEATKSDRVLDFLMQAKKIAGSLLQKSPFKKSMLTILGPISAPMERKAGYFRGLLLFQAKERAMLQKWLTQFLTEVESNTTKSKIRWSLEVDPLELG